jgi:hypothetical protein
MFFFSYYSTQGYRGILHIGVYTISNYKIHINIIYINGLRFSENGLQLNVRLGLGTKASKPSLLPTD